MSYNPMDLIRPNVKVSVTVVLGDPAAEPVVEVIDYAKESGPFYYVVANDTPLSPDVPLPWHIAERKLEQERADAEEGEVFEVVECTDEDLKWAGVTPRSDEGS